MAGIAAMLDETHRADRKSWVSSANGHSDFPIQNLPFGIFSPPGGEPRGGVAIGDEILDLGAVLAAGLLHGEAAKTADVAAGPTLNSFLALGRNARASLRTALCAVLDADGATHDDAGALRAKLLSRAADCTLHLPAQIGDYTDFFAGIHHATNAGRLFRPENPLLPNYKYVPVGYHGRASSIRPSGSGIRRPNGQLKSPDASVPSFSPCRRLDYELELGIWIGPGNELGAPIPIGQAADHVAGFCLLNDWSARDIQAWEYQPLGPFLAKSFGSTISPWIITPEALAPFRTVQPPRPTGDPAPLDYLLDDADQQSGAIDLEMTVWLLTNEMRRSGTPPHRLSCTNASYLYWTVAQMVAHHSCGGCNLQPGDLFGSGTISGPMVGELSSLLELTRGGAERVELPSGETRQFLQDGDEVIIRSRADRPGFASIGFGECRAVVLSALT